MTAAPLVLASLILGPFLIMFLFGLGYSGYREPFRTEIVIPQGNDFPRDPEYYADLAPGRLEVVNVGDDPAPAEQPAATPLKPEEILKKGVKDLLKGLGG